MLSVSKIGKSFGDKEVLHDVDIDVAPGKITALIGPSGGGKTTLIRALSLIDPPNKGKVVIDEVSYHFPLRRGERIRPPWPNLTVVFQQFFLWPHLTLRKNITMPTEYRKGDHSQHIESLIKLFEMEEFVDRYPNQVSLGQRQRAALVRALVLRPSYILLDEITSALDVEQVSAILTHLRQLRGEGIGILVVTHHLKFASRSADQIVFLDQGRVVTSGGADLLDVSMNPRLQDFVSMVKSIA